MRTEFDQIGYQRTVKETFDDEQQKLSTFLQKPIESFRSKDVEVSEYPAMVQIGISTICNLHCPECYYEKFQKGPDFHPTFMNQQIYSKIVNEVSMFPSSTMIRYLGRGESLTHPNFLQMINEAKQGIKGKIALITNGLLMNDKKAEALLQTKIDVVDFSIDATTPATYKLVRGGEFDMLISNIERFIELRNKGDNPTRILVSFLIQPENYQEVENFKKIWDKKVDKIIFRRYHSYAGKIQEKACIPEKRHPCASLWNRININENGKITLCYIDWNESSVMADLNDPKTTILDTWKSAYNKARDGHLSGKLPALCAKCKTGWQAAHWQLSYEQAIDMVTNK